MGVRAQADAVSAGVDTLVFDECGVFETKESSVGGRGYEGVEVFVHEAEAHEREGRFVAGLGG